jgi:hypothetical protein
MMVSQERSESVLALVKTSPMLARNSSATTELDFEVNELPVKRRRIRWNVELNGCFCGSVLDSSVAGVIECKRTGCKTQWVSKILSASGFEIQIMILIYINLFSIIDNVLQRTPPQRIGSVRLVKHREKVEEANVHVDDVILLNLEVCLIM